MKKILSLLFAAVLLCGALLSLSACSPKGLTVAVPNDTTNEARALLLLEAQGIIKLKEGVGINSNYAIAAGINPVKDSLAIEGSAAAYANIVAVKAGNETADKTKALVAALQSQKVVDYINDKYNGSVVSVVEQPGDGYDATVDYSKLAGQTISVAASPSPHAEILAVAKDILAAKNVTLKIGEFSDYVVPNNVVESGEYDANYFQHIPYLDDFNKNNNTHLVSAAAIHNEPMGLYGGKQTTLDALKIDG